MKIAAIDVGSNSVRLIVQTDGKTIYKVLNTTRLGEGLALSGKLSISAMERSVQAIKTFYQQAKQENADKIFAFATAAVRSASNGKDFVQAVKNDCGIEVDVLSGEEEASIGMLGALGKQDGGIIDIGGGSTEITLQRAGTIEFSKSIDIGAVRLLDNCGQDREKLLCWIEKKIQPFSFAKSNLPLYAIGGTATSLGALQLNLQTYDPKKIQDLSISFVQIEKLTDKLFSMTAEERLNLPCIPPKRAEIIAGGALLLQEIMRLLAFSTITISEKDNLEGYILKKGY